MSRGFLGSCVVVVGLGVALVAAPSAKAEPGGCLKYGAAGAVAGHLAHHGVLGATGGCATGMWRRHEYRKGIRAKAAMWDKEHAADAAGGGPKSPDDKAAQWDNEHPATGRAAPATTPSGPSANQPG